MPGTGEHHPAARDIYTLTDVGGLWLDCAAVDTENVSLWCKRGLLRSNFGQCDRTVAYSLEKSVIPAGGTPHGGGFAAATVVHNGPNYPSSGAWRIDRTKLSSQLLGEVFSLKNFRAQAGYPQVLSKEKMTWWRQPYGDSPSPLRSQGPANGISVTMEKPRRTAINNKHINDKI